MASHSRSEKKADDTSLSATSPLKKPHRSEPTRSTHTERAVGTDLPKDVDAPNPQFTKLMDAVHPIGNRKYEFMMNQMGLYGHFFDRSKKSTKPTLVELQGLAIQDAIASVMRTVLRRLLHKKGHIQQDDIQALATNSANTIAEGCIFVLYLRLRSIHRSYPETFKKFLIRPHAPEPFEIPVPFALAIQSIGLFRVSSQPKEIEYLPTLSDAEAATYLSRYRNWSLPLYQSTVEFAKSLGLRFQTADLSVKLGSAWWLLKPVIDDHNFQMQCCLPEDNYTNEDAVLRALFCSSTGGTLHHSIADLSTITLDRGSFMRNPPPDIAVTSFNGINDDEPQSYSIY